MSCKFCSSSNLRKFRTEIAIHLPRLKDNDIPQVFVFPEILVCLKCGFTELVIEEDKLRLLTQDKTSAAGAS